MRVDALDNLTIELQDQTQHAVRGRMLRAEIDRKVAIIAVLFAHAATFSAF
jgi:hypothetical protein